MAKKTASATAEKRQIEGEEEAAPRKPRRRTVGTPQEKDTRIGRIPLGAVSFRLRKRDASGAFHPVTTPSDDGAIELNEFPIEAFDPDVILRVWGPGTFKPSWLVIVDGRRLPPQAGPEFTLRHAEPAPQPNALALAPQPQQAPIAMSPEFAMMRMMQEMNAASMQQTMTMVTALVTAVKGGESSGGGGGDKYLAMLLEQMNEQRKEDRRLFAQLLARRNEEEEEEEDEEEEEELDEEGKPLPPEDWDDFVDMLKGEAFSELGGLATDVTPAAINKVKEVVVEKLLEWQANKGARLQANGASATPKE